MIARGKYFRMASGWEPSLLLDLLCVVGVSVLVMFFAVKRLEKRMVK